MDGPLRFLVVDDDPELREYVRRVLEDGFSAEVLEAGDGLHARELLDTEPIHLLVCDVILPRMGGVELLDHVRSRKGLATLRTLLITGVQVGQPLRERVDADPWTRLLAKPFNAGTLRNAVSALLPR